MTHRTQAAHHPAAGRADDDGLARCPDACADAAGRRLSTRGRPTTGRALLGYIFGSLTAVAVPGPVLVPLMTDLGMSHSAARTSLQRLLQSQDLIAERVGRVAVYRLVGGYADRYQRLTQGDPITPWQGHFEGLLYEIPEIRRTARDELRERAFAHGFAAVRPGLLIGTSDPRRWSAEWLGSSGEVERLRIGCDLATAARMARRAWDLDQRRQEIDTCLAVFDGWSASFASGSLDSLGTWQLLFSGWSRLAAIHARLPPLPAQILPADWPAEAVRSRLVEITRREWDAVQAHLDTRLAEAGPVAGLVVGGGWDDDPQI
ncbi:MAG: hypothetical protein ACK5MT_00210 [Actinomycetales bacterium]